jgi:hypothetical protein
MAMGGDGWLPKPRELCQTVAEYFQQCAESPLLCNRGLGALAVTVCKIMMRRRAGTASLSTSTRLLSRSELDIESPVTFPPARARLATMPLPMDRPRSQKRSEFLSAYP